MAIWNDPFGERIQANVRQCDKCGAELDKAQLRQIQEAASGDIELVKHVLGLFGYQSSKDVEGEKVQAILGTIQQKVAE